MLLKYIADNQKFNIHFKYYVQKHSFITYNYKLIFNAKFIYCKSFF